MAKILIVDDSLTSRKILKGILETAGHEIVGEAPDGVQGVDLYKKLQPDIVTLDITMPVMDGIGALKEIRDVDPDAKAIMVTAAGQKSKMVEAVKYGAAEFVAKPFDEDQLLEVVHRVVEG